MPNNEMDYSLIHRTPDGTGKILVTTPGSPDKGSWETEAELKTYVNQGVVKQTDIVQSLGQQVDKVPSNKAVDDAINAIMPTEYTIEGLVFEKCSYKKGGYCIIGNLVHIDIMVEVSEVDNSSPLVYINLPYSIAPKLEQNPVLCTNDSADLGPYYSLLYYYSSASIRLQAKLPTAVQNYLFSVTYLKR